MDPCYVSVDVETSGPYPAGYSVLAIGACLVTDPDEAFYAELRPQSGATAPGALEVSGLAIAHLRGHGEHPAAAFERLAAWVEGVTPEGSRSVFVGFNAPFDWMFVADGLHRHAGRNPFGHAALDVKSLAMGAERIGWDETSFTALAERYGITTDLPHHALEDARLQAALFRRILADQEEGSTPP